MATRDVDALSRMGRMVTRRVSALTAAMGERRVARRVARVRRPLARERRELGFSCPGRAARPHRADLATQSSSHGTDWPADQPSRR